MAQFGDLLSRGYEALRLVFVAGEVFPIGHLRSLRQQWPHPRFCNLYGPTETNICHVLGSAGANPSRTKRTISHRHNVLSPFLAGNR